jgi:hypothetical protein
LPPPAPPRPTDAPAEAQAGKELQAERIKAGQLQQQLGLLQKEKEAWLLVKEQLLKTNRELQSAVDTLRADLIRSQKLAEKPGVFPQRRAVEVVTVEPTGRTRHPLDPRIWRLCQMIVRGEFEEAAGVAFQLTKELSDSLVVKALNILLERKTSEVSPPPPKKEPDELALKLRQAQERIKELERELEQRTSERNSARAIVERLTIQLTQKPKPPQKTFAGFWQELAAMTPGERQVNHPELAWLFVFEEGPDGRSLGTTEVINRRRLIIGEMVSQLQAGEVIILSRIHEKHPFTNNALHNPKFFPGGSKGAIATAEAIADLLKKSEIS